MAWLPYILHEASTGVGDVSGRGGKPVLFDAQSEFREYPEARLLKAPDALGHEGFESDVIGIV